MNQVRKDCFECSYNQETRVGTDLDNFFIDKDIEEFSHYHQLTTDLFKYKIRNQSWKWLYSETTENV